MDHALGIRRLMDFEEIIGKQGMPLHPQADEH